LATGVPVAGLVVFTDRARFPKGLPSGVTKLSGLSRRLSPVAGASIPADYRRAWDAVLGQARTDGDARREQLDMARLRKAQSSGGRRLG
jgi:hypothetical protein